MSSDSAVIHRLLVANRGEIARRIFRSARDMGIETVAVYADGDADAPFVTEADYAVALGGRSPAESYLDTAKVLDAARRTGADAVHPGYGFLSENADFARSVVDAGLIWVGPPAEAIAAMGDKLAAKEMMVAAGVPTLPSIEVTAGTDLLAAAQKIGFPVLVKASAGGGGKGMRVVETPTDLIDAVAGAQREAEGAFGNGTVFLERYLTAPRHVEIQVLGDQHGTLVHCFERECSIQRRHQKIIEEAPSPALSDSIRTAMGEAGLAASRTLGYYSAGTVEFLLDGEGDDAAYYFLEVNTRLQVEHPVTEEVTGLDLVREQLRIAVGERLGYAQEDLTITGHAIEARLYAEDPANEFLPATGVLTAFEPPREPHARFDSGVETGSLVGVDFDPMLAKVIVHAPTRTEAARRLALVLDRTTIAGVTTNRDFLVSTLRSDAFLAGDTTTDFIARVGPAPRFVPSSEELAVAAIGAALFRQSIHRATAGALSFLRSGYRNSSMPPEEVRFGHGDEEIVVRYASQRDHSFRTTVQVGEHVHDEMSVRVVDASHAAPFGITLDIDGLQSSMVLAGFGTTWHVHGRSGGVDLIEHSRFPEQGNEGVEGGQVAPMPGKVLVVDVAVGDVVTAGQRLIVMEAMKMEHTIAAPDAASVAEVRCAEGDQVDNGQVLVVLETLDAT